jgi:hypothetical protein
MEKTDIDKLMEKFVGFKHYPVTWFSNVIKVSKGYNLSLGLCGYSKGVAFIAFYNPKKPITTEFLKTIIIRDVIVDVKKGICDDADWCFNLNCPLNHAQLQHFKKYGIKNREHLERFQNVLEEAVKKLGLKPQEGVVVFYNEPILRLVR